jgi:hypothetical protein
MSEKSTFRNELKIVPELAWFIAFAIGLCSVIALFFVAAHDRGVPRAMAPVLALLCGFVIVCWILLLGYVSADARRRGMSPLLWTLICIFVPNLIGFIIYFMLRKPLPRECPGCGFWVNDTFRYCPRCRYALAPVCSSCGQAVRADYVCCPYCGQAVGGGNSPVVSQS